MTTSSHLCVALLFLTWGFPYLETFSLCSANTDVRCIESKREALLQFKRSLNDSMGRLSSWDGEECCTWTGISCSNKTQHVVKLNLSAPAVVDDNGFQLLQLEGEINSSLVNLKHLQYLDLSYNNFNGIRIPTFIGSLQKLKYLDLSGACFGGSVRPHLGNLSSLHHLNLLVNQFLHTCDVELKVDNLHWLRGLSSLRYLNMGVVNLSTEGWVQHISMLPLLSQLRLHGCGLSSLPLSHGFSNLTSLTFLDLSENNFDSSMLQWLFNLTNLETLDLLSSSIVGPIPDSFKNMTSLQSVDLTMNEINGHLPTSLGTLCNLQKLRLPSNNITRPITELVEGLSACSANRLRSLDLSNNNMNGMIPKGLGKLSELVELDLSNNNHWEGVLSEDHFHNLTNLERLAFSSSSTSLSLNVSSIWIPPFSRITDLDFGNCQVGPKFPSWIRFQKHLQTLCLTNTGILDNMPDWIQNLTSLFLLDLSYNQIRGSFPVQISYESGNKTSSTSSSHQPIPHSFSSLRYAILGNNLFSGVIPFNIDEIMSYVKVLDLSMNSIHGEIPSSICMLHNLMTLALSTNHISGEIPPCSWKSSQHLSLCNNNLTGEIPNEIGFSPLLFYLKLSNNNLHGKVPLSLQQLKELMILDLGENNFSGELLMWMGEGFLSLIVLRLRSNVFTGYILLQLCSFSSLQILDLGDNKLSGPIPSCFGNLSAMARVEFNRHLLGMYLGIGRFTIQANTNVVKGRDLEYTKNLVLLASLDLSNNHLIGEIPSELTRLEDLQILNLSMNHLTGLVPKQIGHMKQLEALDLSTNQLNGMIPPTISDLNFLSHLNLSNNNLSGRIPSGNQLNTLNDSSVYKGNSQLCGPPITSKCPGDSVTPSPVFVVGDEEDESKTELLYFYVGIA